MSIKVIFAASALAASSLVNAAVIPVRRQEANSCVGKQPGDQFVSKLASNVQFEVICGRDYYGGDLENGLRWPGSFEGCLAACDSEPECKAVSWVDGPCYLKGAVSSLLDGNPAVWTAKKNPPPTCDGSVNSDGASYITSAGKFQIMCGKDYAGNDLKGVSTDSFAACIDHCAADEQCVDVSYVYGACYPKSALGTVSDASWVWTAKFLGTRASPSPSPSADVSPSATPSSDATPTPAVPKALSCIDKASNGAKYKEFEVECGVDHWGADIGAVPTTTTFEECMDACEANTECAVVSWVWGSCYMKNAKNEGQNADHVWGAVRAARVPVVASSDAVITPSATPDASVTPVDSAVVTPTPAVDASVTPSEDAAIVTPTPAADASVTPSEDAAAITPTPVAVTPSPDAAAVTPPPEADVFQTPEPLVIAPSEDAKQLLLPPTPAADASVTPAEEAAAVTPTPTPTPAADDAASASITPTPTPSSTTPEPSTSTLTID
ncbi:hypothetical protein C7974DRAFT_439803 [Boeremia exigua]|uniref:uncharacterized protein n=1 Tax=Boeremia exigua TaxID=749465 RepID=UPI001E8ECB9E|nr:uncharacterized protein C7974DRAFT_439803 [Boeremia exigua]KAH6644461.1 hypothetical protein C7974DRAFT_439803 [Boeremia exigua]